MACLLTRRTGAGHDQLLDGGVGVDDLLGLDRCAR